MELVSNSPAQPCSIYLDRLAFIIIAVIDAMLKLQEWDT